MRGLTSGIPVSTYVTSSSSQSGTKKSVTVLLAGLDPEYKIASLRLVMERKNVVMGEPYVGNVAAVSYTIFRLLFVEGENPENRRRRILCPYLK